MKRNLLYPSFEMVFALGIVAILALPPLVMAQDTKEFKVTITNGDTTINGKNIKKMSAAERSAALKEMDESGVMMFNDGTGHHTLSVNGKSAVKGKRVIIERDIDEDGTVLAYAPAAKHFNSSADSGTKKVVYTYVDPNGVSQRIEAGNMFKQGDAHASNWSIGPARTPIIGMNRKNTQTFNYSSTDNDGINTHVNFMVTDANAETLKRIAAIDKAELQIKDLNLVPSFSTGKTAVSFTLPEKGNANIAFKNTDGNTLWTDKITNTSFYKSFDLPQNGVYYLEVRQDGKIGLRKIVKE